MNHMPIKLILLDLDGTLLNSDKKISHANYAALEKAAAKGIHIVPCTGRFYRGMPEVVRQLPFVRYVITINGAQIYDAWEDRVLHSAEISAQRADAVFAVLETLPVVFDCYQDGWGWMDRELYENAPNFIHNPHTLKMARELRTPVDNFREEIRRRNRGVQKIQMFFADMALREKTFGRLRQQFPELNVTSSIENNIELNAPDAHKGAALLELCRQLKIDPASAMAFGDGLNDLSMIRTAGIGIVMGNAEEEIKAAGDYVTDTNDNDGVAKAIERFCFGGL